MPSTGKKMIQVKIQVLFIDVYPTSLKFTAIAVSAKFNFPARCGTLITSNDNTRNKNANGQEGCRYQKIVSNPAGLSFTN